MCHSRHRATRGTSQGSFADRVGDLGFGKTRFHDLRGIHSTALLDAGIPVHTVAQRIGDDPATLLRSYTKRQRLKQADEKLSSTITGLAAGFLGTGNDSVATSAVATMPFV